MLEKLILINKLSLNLATKNFGSVGYEAVILSLHKLELLEELDLNIGVNKCGTRGIFFLINFRCWWFQKSLSET